jgi:hypothetical protein
MPRCRWGRWPVDRAPTCSGHCGAG